MANKGMLEWYKSLPPSIWGGGTPGAQGGGAPTAVGGAPIGFTGYGADGKNQPHMPTNLVQTANGPTMLHEGEPTMEMPDGSVRVVSQEELKRMEDTMPIGGMQGGGNFIRPGQRPPAATPSFNRDTTPTRDEKPAEVSIIKPEEPLIKPGTIPEIGLDKPAEVSLTSPDDPLIKPGTIPEAVEPAEVGAIGEETTREVTITPGTPRGKDAVEVGAVDEEEYRESGMEFMEDVMTGGSDRLRNIWNRAIDQFGGASAAATGALKQQAAQMGLSPEETMTMMQSRTRDIEGTRSLLLGELAGIGAQEAIGAATFLATQGLAGMQFASGEQWNQFNAAMQSGDFETASGLYESISGEPLDTTRLQEQWDFNQSTAQWNFDNLRRTTEGQALTAHFQNMGTVEGYSWRGDSSARNMLQAAWESQGNSGTFTDDWAQTQFDAATQSPSAAFGSSLHNSPTYQNAPATSVYGDDGEIITAGKDFWDKVIGFHQEGMDFGYDIGYRLDENGNVVAVDKTTGDDLSATDDDPGAIDKDEQGFAIYDPEDPVSVRGAVNHLVDDLMYFGDSPVEFQDMQRYIEEHEGRAPESKSEWEDWYNETIFIPEGVETGGVFFRNGGTYLKTDANSYDDMYVNLDQVTSSDMWGPIADRLVGAGSMDDQNIYYEQILEARTNAVINGSDIEREEVLAMAADDPLYQRLLTDNRVGEFSPEGERITKGTYARQVIPSLDNLGGSQLVVVNGALYMVTKRDAVDEKFARDSTDYELTPVGGGDKMYVNSNMPEIFLPGPVVH